MDQDLAEAADGLLSLIWHELESDVPKPTSAAIASNERLERLVATKFGQYAAWLK